MFVPTPSMQCMTIVLCEEGMESQLSNLLTTQETRGNQLACPHSVVEGEGCGAPSASSPRRCRQTKDLPYPSKTTALGSTDTQFNFSSPEACTGTETLLLTSLSACTWRIRQCKPHCMRSFFHRQPWGQWEGYRYRHGNGH